jgi:hypothetical protein
VERGDHSCLCTTKCFASRREVRYHVPVPGLHPDPVALTDRATESLDFIRTTMARSAPFTAVPGRGGMAMGAVGLAAAWMSSQQTTPRAWLAVWIGAATVAVSIGLASMWMKARAAGMPLWSAAGRRFAQAFIPALAAGAALTAAAAFEGREVRLPGTWLLLYGAAVIAAGSTSVRVLTMLGSLLMSLGVVALALPSGSGTLCLAIGFGVLHIVFGFIVARNHGG